MQDVKITLERVHIHEDGTREVTKEEAVGTFSERGSASYLIYEGIVSEDVEKVAYTIKKKGDVIELVEKGAMQARIVFEAGVNYSTVFHTPYGALLMDIKTHSVRDLSSDAQICYRLEYATATGDAVFEEWEMLITARPC